MMHIARIGVNKKPEKDTIGSMPIGTVDLLQNASLNPAICTY